MPLTSIGLLAFDWWRLGWGIAAAIALIASFMKFPVVAAARNWKTVQKLAAVIRPLARARAILHHVSCLAGVRRDSYNLKFG